MTETTQPQIFNNVPSPFCGIASDDLTIEVTGHRVKVLENGDAVTIAGFEQPYTDTTPRIAGAPVSLDQAIARVAEILKQARLPVLRLWNGCQRNSSSPFPD